MFSSLSCLAVITSYKFALHFILKSVFALKISLAVSFSSHSNSILPVHKATVFSLRQVCSCVDGLDLIFGKQCYPIMSKTIGRIRCMMRYSVCEFFQHPDSTERRNSNLSPGKGPCELCTPARPHLYLLGEWFHSFHQSFVFGQVMNYIVVRFPEGRSAHSFISIEDIPHDSPHITRGKAGIQINYMN